MQIVLASPPLLPLSDIMESKVDGHRLLSALHADVSTLVISVMREAERWNSEAQLHSGRITSRDS